MAANTTIGKWILKFTNFYSIETVHKITSAMHFVTYVTRHFAIIFQKMKKLAKLFKLLRNFVY